MERGLGLIGAGRLGQVLAEKLAPHYPLFIHDRDTERAAKLATKTRAEAVSLAGVTEASALILALPAEVVGEVARELTPVLSPWHVLVNVATSLPRKVIEEVVGSRCPVASAKIIGHAAEIWAGEEPVVVIDAPDARTAQRVAHIFQKIGTTVFDNEEVVRRLNTLASLEGVRAALAIKKRMQEEGIPERYYRPAVRGVAAGTMRAFADGDVGPFLRQLVEELEDAKGSGE